MPVKWVTINWDLWHCTDCMEYKSEVVGINDFSASQQCNGHIDFGVKWLILPLCLKGNFYANHAFVHKGTILCQGYCWQGLPHPGQSIIDRKNQITKISLYVAYMRKFFILLGHTSYTKLVEAIWFSLSANAVTWIGQSLSIKHIMGTL